MCHRLSGRGGGCVDKSGDESVACCLVLMLGQPFLSVGLPFEESGVATLSLHLFHVAVALLACFKVGFLQSVIVHGIDGTEHHEGDEAREGELYKAFY